MWLFVAFIGILAAVEITSNVLYTIRKCNENKYNKN
jgi:hypothetical protein